MKDTLNLTNVYGTKSITLDQYPPEAWDFLEGDADGIDKASIRQLSEAVPWLFRGLQIIVQAASTVPVCLMLKDKEVGYLGGELDTSLLFIEDLPALIRKICASLVLEGYGYLFRDNAATVRATKKLWYWNPLTVTFDEKKTAADRKITFKRRIGSVSEVYTSDQVLYFWAEDAYVEIGPPQTSPAKAALSAAGVLYNVDQYVAAYFKRGAIKAMMLSVKGSPPNEAQKTELQKWWKDLTGGVRKAFNVFTVNADSVTPTIIGDGLEGLQDSELTKEKREDISTALGIPQSILFSTGAGGLGGGGVMNEDTFRFYQLTIVPLIEFIVDVFNRQQFKGTDYRLEVREQDMSLFQEDEGQRATSIKAMVDALADPALFLVAAKIQGYDLSEEVEQEILALIAKKEENAAAMAEQLKPKEPVIEAKPVEEEDDTPDEKSADMGRLRRKALKNIGKDFDFVSPNIPNLPELLARLKACKDADEVKAIFDAPVVVEEKRMPDLVSLLDTAIKAMQDEQPAINVTVNNYPDEAPIVNVSPAEVKAEQPVINVSVEPTPVQVNVSPSTATIENTVNVEPPVNNVKVNVPKVKKAKVIRDPRGNVTGIEEA